MLIRTAMERKHGLVLNTQEIWSDFLALPPARVVTLGKSLDLAVPLFPIFIIRGDIPLVLLLVCKVLVATVMNHVGLE